MQRFTDIHFQLPLVVALTAQDALSGTTQPVIISGTNNVNNTLEDFVVKPRGCVRLIGGGSMREFLAAFIALELELNVPDPAIIQISNQFIESTRYTDNFKYFTDSSGNNFGSKYVEGFITIIEDFSLFRKHYLELQKLLVFDILISTSDRRRAKPNMALYDGSIYIYDHELSFGFYFALTPNPEPWKIIEPDRTAIEGHILFNYFKSKKFECDNFIDTFSRLDNNFWNKAQSFIPADLMDGDQFEKIKNNLTSKIENLSVYREEIIKVLL